MMSSDQHRCECLHQVVQSIVELGSESFTFRKFIFTRMHDTRGHADSAQFEQEPGVLQQVLGGGRVRVRRPQQGGNVLAQCVMDGHVS